MKKDSVTDFISYAFMVAGILVLTRDDHTAEGIAAVTRGYSDMIRVATGMDNEAQLRLFTDNYMHDPDADLSELEAELDRRIGLVRERHHRSFLDQVTGKSRVRSKKVQYD